MRATVIFLMFIQMSAWGQLDTNFIQLIPRDRTVQFHTTVKDFSVTAHLDGKSERLFRNYNWSTGMYFKWGIAELFFALPVAAFDNQTVGSPRTFGTGFGLNLYPRKFHLNYNFKFVQGFQDFQQVRTDGFATLAQNNYFFFNRLNTHYVASDRFSLKSALRFNNRQLQSAGSMIFKLPLNYHFGKSEGSLSDEFQNVSILGIGALAGYGYTYVYKGWATSAIFMAGYDLRRFSFKSMSQWRVLPAINYVLSSVYNWNSNFIGLTYNDYPEFVGRNTDGIRIVNWKLRLYAGRRFY